MSVIKFSRNQKFIPIFVLILCCYLFYSQFQSFCNHEKNDGFYSYFQRFTNVSFPIAYSVNFYENYDKLATIYLITPTHARIFQLADLTRLRNTLWLVPKILWIVVEDSEQKTHKIQRFLEDSNLPHVHLNIATPNDMKLQEGSAPWSKPRGLLQRNAALQWLRKNSLNLNKGVVYFADDDNTYDVRLFEEMRTTNKVSVWPVALSSEILYEAPACENGKVLKWAVAWKPYRKFPMDMCGFAINLQLLIDHPLVEFVYSGKSGMLENDFLSQLVDIDDLEAKADNCKKILVWHTKTAKFKTGKINVTYDETILESL